jgi:protein O-mannosyl-transferase
VKPRRHPHPSRQPEAARPRFSVARTRSTTLYTAVIIIVGALCYANSLSGPFVFDDRVAIVENASVHSFGGVLNGARNTPIAGRPLVALSFALNHRIGGLDVRGYHAANIVVHLITALLLFGVARRTLLMPGLDDGYRSHADGLACAMALLWVVHPLNTEAVNYVTERTESLMALMFILTLYASIRARGESRTAIWQGIAIVACALGMACKESMVAAPVIVMLYDRAFVFDSAAQAMRKRWRLYAGLCATWLVLVYLLIPGPRSGSAGLESGVDVWTYLMNQAVMIVRYLRLAIWPSSLVINYGPPQPLTLTQVLPQALAVMALVLLSLLALIRKPRVGFLCAFVFVMLAPTSSIIPIATEVGAERRMYLPLMALVALAVLGVHQLLLVNRRMTPVLGIVLLAVTTTALAAATQVRHREYGSALELARTTLERWPSSVAHGMVGGELAALGRDQEAIPDLRIAAIADPLARYNLGITLFNQKDYAGTIRELEQLARDFPMREEIPLARRAIGNAYAQQQKWADAIAQYRLVLSMVPSDQIALRLLVETLLHQGTSLASAGRPSEAIAAFREARDRDPSNAIARHNLAVALFDSGDLASALAEARLTIATIGGDAASYDLIGRALALQGKFDEAADALEQALRLNPNDRETQDDLKQVAAARERMKRRGHR